VARAYVSGVTEQHETNALRPAGRLVHRHRWPVRLWHWVNALSVFVMLMSGLMIFNAHPMLYWGRYGANHDHSWLAITPGHLRVGPLTVPTPGLLGTSPGGRFTAFPPLVTIPSHYDLAGARQWHLAFAWLLVVPGLAYLAWALARRHVQRDLWPTAAELRPAHLWHDVKQHARLRFPTGEAAARYNILQKLAYCGVILVAIPGAVLTGLTLSPGMDAAWPWLLELFGGRQSARSIHFLCAAALATFIIIHIAMVVLAGPLNELRSMVTGRYRLPADRDAR
jgi:Ni/Fe-hydrogenase b-type cytochrome subunit